MQQVHERNRVVLPRRGGPGPGAVCGRYYDGFEYVGLEDAGALRTSNTGGGSLQTERVHIHKSEVLRPRLALLEHALAVIRGEVARSHADVEMLGANIGGEEFIEEGGGTAPDIVVVPPVDEKIIDTKAEAVVDGIAAFHRESRRKRIAIKQT